MASMCVSQMGTEMEFLGPLLSRQGRPHFGGELETRLAGDGGSTGTPMKCVFQPSGKLQLVGNDQFLHTYSCASRRRARQKQELWQ